MQENDLKVDQSTIKDLIEDSLISTQPAMMVNMKAYVTGGNLSSCNKLFPGSLSGSPAPVVPKLLLQNLCGLHLGSEEAPGLVDREERGVGRASGQFAHGGCPFLPLSLPAHDLVLKLISMSEELGGSCPSSSG
ncbi:phospholipid transfer protein C2CD2L-like [Sceloporus undulatus]|uniref:phospholipid transfer protein C2CD2L-like n=1 Tax=Sceloporus undulatus TaxID=8520 RepID=UPI001C4D4569|nr:phospholipid transfer protein C2CD2L-like [Sceloporus undulatus]